MASSFCPFLRTVPYDKKAFPCLMEVLIRTITKWQCRLGTSECDFIANLSYGTIVRSVLNFLMLVRYFRSFGNVPWCRLPLFRGQKNLGRCHWWRNHWTSLLRHSQLPHATFKQSKSWLWHTHWLWKDLCNYWLQREGSAKQVNLPYYRTPSCWEGT